ncbi:hypothetical protein KC866_00300 [Patescibacteria group bacterium]|nr:hypothetical protein [Patescibacteria group bacterium]
MKNLFQILILIGVVYIIIYRFKQQRNYSNFDDYLTQKRVSLSTDKYRRFLEQKRAEVQSQIRIREQKGLKPDPVLDGVLKTLEEEQRKLG